MKKELIEKATFSEVYRLLKEDPDSDIFQCFKSLFDVSLLFFPALMCKEVAIITNIATGATLVGAGVCTIVGNAAKGAFNLFKNRNHGDYATRYEQMQIAQVLLVFASYFDTISRYLPNENGEIILSNDAKWKISQDGLEAYLENLKKAAYSQRDTPKLLTEEIVLPDPTQEFSKYTDGLNEFYEALNLQFRDFFGQLSFWKEIEGGQEELDKAQKEYFWELLGRLPRAAVHTYEQQYFELSKEFPDFAIWANHIEHDGLKKRMDIGFKKIASDMKQLYRILEHSESEALGTLAHYRDKYAKYINEPVIKNDKGDFDGDIVFPAQKDIFVPQAFQSLIYHKPMLLEKNHTWENAFSGEEIGQYIRSILCHPKYGEYPMIILGLPGAGKTLLCHMLAAQILSAEYYVVIIKLRNAIAEDTIMKQIDAQIEEDLGDDCKWNDLRKASLDKPLLLIFDGYDELLQASGKTYSNYLDNIADFQEQQRSIYHVFVRCIITSRTTLIDKASIPNKSHIIRLCDFDDKRIQAWSRIWNQANKQYFTDHNISRLEIGSSGRIKELAGQPLLLLMLALYEMNGNQLQAESNISRAELYYKLIFDFVKREKEKDENFFRMTAHKQGFAIREGFRHLGIAALGMYNRKKLFIRTSELNKDLSFLMQGGTIVDDTDEYSLEAGEKLVGSFFFIHSSMSAAQISGNRAEIKAYEFLHNTFNEFLTAYYILDITFRIVKRQIVYLEQDEAFSWTESLKKEWHVSLAYTPLFTRPVVMNMIHELSEIMAEENNVECKKILETLDCLLQKEIRHVIDGDIFAELNNTLKMQGNPFKHPELMLHVASYSINLILMRVLVCSDNFNFTERLGSGSDWKKLTHIWQYAFSEEELVNLSSLLNLKHSGETYQISYRYDEEAANRALSLSRIDRLCRISSVLGDDVGYAVFGSFGSMPDENILSILEKENLGLRTKYALNAVFKCSIFSQDDRRKLKESLLFLYECCKKEKDAFGLYFYCALLHSLIDQHILDKYDLSLLNRNVIRTLSKVVVGLPHGEKWGVLSITFQEILRCVYALPDQGTVEVLTELASYFAYEIVHTWPKEKYYKGEVRYIINTLSLFCKVSQSAIEKRKLTGLEELCYAIFRCINEIYDFFTVREVVMLVRLLKAMKKMEDNRYIEEIFILCTRVIAKNNFRIVDAQLNPVLYSTLIEYYYMDIKQYREFSSAYDIDFFEEYFSKVGTMSVLLPTYEKSFYYLLCMLCDGIFTSEKLRINMIRDLHFILEKYRNCLSLRTVSKIKEYAYLVHEESICLEIERLMK